MKKLILGVVVAMGLALAQAPYVGAHVGFFSGFGAGFPISGFHLGVALQEGLEVRGGVDFLSFFGIFLNPGLSVDFLLNLNMPFSLFSQLNVLYGGLGGRVGLLLESNGFGVHATLGVKSPISGTSAMSFVEIQPTYAFSTSSRGNSFGYYMKAGVDYNF